MTTGTETMWAKNKTYFRMLNPTELTELAKHNDLDAWKPEEMSALCEVLAEWVEDLIEQEEKY